MKVPFLDLRRQVGILRAEIEDSFHQFLDSGSYILGSEVAAFEKEFAAFHQLPYAAGTGNGTDAIALALLACGRIEPHCGQEVITTTITAGFTALAIRMAGAVPVLADVCPDTLQISPDQVESLITSRTRAILPVHLYGQSADLDPLRQIAGRHDLALIEDCSQAHGTEYRGRKVGTCGSLATFSFYPTKNLGAFGDGGMVLSASEEMIQKVRLLRGGGIDKSGGHAVAGINSRLDEIHAAMLRRKLPLLEAWSSRRRLLAGRYLCGLQGTSARPCLPGADRAALSSWTVPDGHTFHLFVIRHPRRDELQGFLRERGIQALVHYPLPLHSQPAFRPFVRAGQRFPEADAAVREILSLPLYPELTEEEQDLVIQAVRDFERR